MSLTAASSLPVAAAAPYPSSFFVPGQNCWRITKADQAAVLIDCANYFKALHHALCNARHSIFILGWDIDGRIELLRGKDADNQDKPVALFDIINWKARENPDMQIYLNRWNYSIFFVKEREPLSGARWRFGTPSNVHYCADYKIPLSACHHQKVIVVDDEVAFNGGMDIALGRWDRRQHHLDACDRVDPGGLITPEMGNPYTPYHDIQMMVTGPVVKDLAALARDRWVKGAGYEALPLENHAYNRPALWQPGLKPDFTNVDVAIARTLPRTAQTPTIDEIEEAYIKEISTAQKFIYIENQYLTCQSIARALNRQLKAAPDLRILAVSCKEPHGLMEEKSMWTGRTMFCDIVEKDVGKDRFAVVHPVCQENGFENPVHIHSKLLIVDDRFLHLGSANLNHRSMGFDTECDLIIEGKDEESRASIARIRSNLIREHTGREENDIDAMIEDATPLATMLTNQTHSRQHLHYIDETEYRHEWLGRLARKLGDSKQAPVFIHLPIRQIVTGLLLLVAALGAFALFTVYDLGTYLDRENMAALIEGARASPWSPLIIIGIYLAAGVVFFPVMALNLTTAVVFGPVYGFLLAFAGSLSSAAMGYGGGRLIGKQSAMRFGKIIKKLRGYTDKGGVAGMTIVRFIPIAPFTLVNLAFGILRVPFAAYMAAAFLGLLPGIFLKALFGGALGELWRNPQPHSIALCVAALVAWIGLTVLLQVYFGRRKQGAQA